MEGVKIEQSAKYMPLRTSNIFCVRSETFAPFQSSNFVHHQHHTCNYTQRRIICYRVFLCEHLLHGRASYNPLLVKNPGTATDRTRQPNSSRTTIEACIRMVPVNCPLNNKFYRYCAMLLRVLLCYILHKSDHEISGVRSAI